MAANWLLRVKLGFSCINELHLKAWQGAKNVLPNIVMRTLVLIVKNKRGQRLAKNVP